MNDTQPKMYNDFLSDVSIPIEDRIFCEGCEQWIPKENTVHTCYCAKQSRGEDISDCNCTIHRRCQPDKVDNREVNPMEFSDSLIGTLHFYDKYDLNIAVKAMDWALAVWDLDNEYRGVVRCKTHIDEFSEEFINGVEWAREQLYVQLEIHGVSLGDIE